MIYLTLERRGNFINSENERQTSGYASSTVIGRHSFITECFFKFLSIVCQRFHVRFSKEVYNRDDVLFVDACVSALLLKLLAKIPF